MPSMADRRGPQTRSWRESEIAISCGLVNREGLQLGIFGSLYQMQV
jgi:hypothetical protein